MPNSPLSSELAGHSMGGLDARYLASQLGFAERVADLSPPLGLPIEEPVWEISLSVLYQTQPFIWRIVF